VIAPAGIDRVLFTEDQVNQRIREVAADFFQGRITTMFCASLIQFGCSLGVDHLLLAKLGKKRNRHLHLSLGESVHKRVEAVAVGRHAPIIGSPAMSEVKP